MTPRIWSWNVALRSAVRIQCTIRQQHDREERMDARCVTLAFLNLRAIGLTNLSNFGGFLVKLSPTNVAFVTILFLPMTFLVGYFGMNFEEFPALKNSDAYFWWLCGPVTGTMVLVLM